MAVAAAAVAAAAASIQLMGKHHGAIETHCAVSDRCDTIFEVKWISLSLFFHFPQNRNAFHAD